MMIQLMGLAFLALFYGLAWHNQPSKEPKSPRPAGRIGNGPRAAGPRNSL